MKEQRADHTFPPLFDPKSVILILGSFPSVKSREAAFYYAHPQNRFWAILSVIYDEKKPASIEEKKALILRHHLALYDVIESCKLIGSSDSSITAVVPADLALIHAPIKKILLNGETSGRLFERYETSFQAIPHVVLPSSSPANAQYSLPRLVQEWRSALLDN